MNVLGKELSKKFDRFYNTVLEATGRPIEFRPLSSLPPAARENIKGRTWTEDNTEVVCLDTHLPDEEFELAAVHELCHRLLRSQGIGIQWRIEVTIPDHLRPTVETEVASLMDCISHVGVNRCMKRHGYDIASYDNRDLDRLRGFIRGREPITQEAIVMHAVHYISHVYRLRYECPSVDVREMARLYRKWQPKIITFAKELMRQIPDVDFMTPMGYYQATKALRDAIGLDSALKLRNPQTGQPE